MSNLKRNSISSANEGCFRLRVGTAKSEITNGASGNSVNDPLYAKALVLDDGKTKVAIIAMDVTAIGGRTISDGMLPDVGNQRRKLAENTDSGFEDGGRLKYIAIASCNKSI